MRDTFYDENSTVMTVCSKEKYIGIMEQYEASNIYYFTKPTEVDEVIKSLQKVAQTMRDELNLKGETE